MALFGLQQEDQLFEVRLKTPLPSHSINILNNRNKLSVWIYAWIICIKTINI